MYCLLFLGIILFKNFDIDSTYLHSTAGEYVFKVSLFFEKYNPIHLVAEEHPMF